MKRIGYNGPLGSYITGILANYKDDWQKLVPRCLQGNLRDLYNACDGELETLHGFYIGTWPEFAIIIFMDSEDCDVLSTLAHESGHVQRWIIWGIGDKMSKKGDETYAKIETEIYEDFKKQLKDRYGMVDTVKWEPNKRQKKNEIK